MPLSWNEIKHRAIIFSKDWKDETREDAEAKSFWDAFFNVFGVQRRTVASFEEPVKKLSGDWGFIDLFWPGTLLAEHKSAGKDLGKAHAQGMAYIRALADSGREKESPRYLVVSDFQRIAIHDLEPEQDPDLPEAQRLPPSFEFQLEDFHKHIRHFFFIAGYKQHKLNPEDPANEEATRLMCDLYDSLEEGEYGTDTAGEAGHELKQFLVRLLFCLFGEDNGIFPTRAFQLYIEDHTAPDGSDLGPKLGQLFEVLNTEEDRRQKHLEEDLKQFPYVNGDLFRERLALPAFTSAMRNKLLACSAFDWSTISPAVFGSLFQAVMEPKERRQIGAHYTSERNIMKVVRSLFLDDLRGEFKKLKALKVGKRERLEAFHKRIAGLKFLDPACGCGNFLVITYRELRSLELEILTAIHAGQRQLHAEADLSLSLIDVDQMYGIEIEEFPARIAEVALWLADHQANVRHSEAFGQFYIRIPLRKSPHIHVANALRFSWKDIIKPEECSYILGNPPFVGKHLMSPAQEKDMGLVWGNLNGAGFLDYVTAWYRTAAEYISGTRIQAAFVSTNSICQGEQVGILWNDLFQRWHIKINFAHRTFSWSSEARGKAHVHVVIIGFGSIEGNNKHIYDYETSEVDPTITPAQNISPYLVEGPDIALPIRRTPICNVPEIINGNKPVDGGFLIVNPEERDAFLIDNPEASPFLRVYLSAEDLINGTVRYILWLKDAPPEIIRRSPGIIARLEGVRDFRANSKKLPTRAKAETPALFDQVRQPTTTYLAIPKTSSENRVYIPMLVINPDVIASTELQMIPEYDDYTFGVLTSAMHMAWMRQVCGRLKSDYRYSNKIVYNNYPWPDGPTASQKQAVKISAKRVLETRSAFHNSTLADLYDPVTMPAVLHAAHAMLDKAVDRCYRKEPFTTDRARIEFLFSLYAKLTAPLVAATKMPKVKPT